MLAVAPDGARPAPARARRLRRRARRRPGGRGRQPDRAAGRTPARPASRRPGSAIEAPGGYLIDDVLETDAVIEPGQLGRPAARRRRPRGRHHLAAPGDGETSGFAVPANIARDVVGQLEEAGKVVRAVHRARAPTPVSGGAQMTDVQVRRPGGGVRRPDGRRRRVDRRPAVATLGELLGEVDEHAPGQSVELGVLRDGARGDVEHARAPDLRRSAGDVDRGCRSGAPADVHRRTRRPAVTCESDRARRRRIDVA